MVVVVVVVVDGWMNLVSEHISSAGFKLCLNMIFIANKYSLFYIVAHLYL
jgi:hypothetical protein